MADILIARSRSGSLWKIVGLALLVGAWIAPNKIFPWVSLWNESLAAFATLLLALAALGKCGRYRVSWPVVALLVFGIASVWVQWELGQIDWAGDVWVVCLYLGGLVLAVTSSGVLAGGDEGTDWHNSLLIAILVAGAVSTAIALVQALWATAPVIYVAEIETIDRPYANLGQPNHLSTLCFLALCCALQLRRERTIGWVGTLLLVALLTLGMALTQSRTGVLQWGLLFVFGLWAKPIDRAPRWRWGALVLVLGVTWWMVLPWLYEVWLLPGGMRGMAESGGSGRLQIWRAFWDAVWLRPWAGWGWLQSGAAQQAVAACHPDTIVYFSYTHLLPLDFFLWLGLPLGLLLCAVLAWWLGPYLTRARSAQAGYWLVAVLGLGVHALLEYPQAYLYFLLPVGLMIGVIEAQVPVHRVLRVPAWAMGLAWLALAGLSAVVFVDAVRASNAYTEVRFADARIGTRSAPPEVPRLVLLDQLQAFVQLRATSVEAAPTEATLNEAARVTRRQPLRWVSMRYAQLLALAGQHEAAAQEQQRLCDINGPEQCALWGRMWNEWRATRAPQDLGIAPFEGRALGPRCDAPAPAG